MHLTGLGTALPSGIYTQAECLAALQSSPQYPQLTARSQVLLRKVLSGENGILTRHLAVETLAQAFVLTPDALHARFALHAPALATQAAERALTVARLRPDEVDAVIISTCTGYLCPGLTSYVGERLGLRGDILALDLVGQGCGAALPNFRTAETLVSSGRARHVLSICVEICSAALFLDDDPGVLISTCLFGDGAGAVIWSAQPVANLRSLQWKSAQSRHYPADREALRFESRNGMLRNILSRDVPQIAAAHVERLLDEMLDHYPLRRDELTGWILHGGGREVLAALQKRLGLSDADVRLSSAVLREVGNVSSPFVIFVLEQALKTGAPGGWWWLASFGAGFSCHGALLKVD